MILTQTHNVNQQTMCGCACMWVNKHMGAFLKLFGCQESQGKEKKRKEDKIEFFMNFGLESIPEDEEEETFEPCYKKNSKKQRHQNPKINTTC